MNHAVRTNGKLAGFHRSGKRGIQAAEIRLRDASAVTNAAIMACGAPFVHASEHGRAANGEDAVIESFCQGVPEVLLDAGHFHRREKFPVRKLRQPLGLAADSCELFHVVVPRRDIRVANRPVNRDAFLCVGLKIEIAPAIRLAAPGDRFAANLASANPGKMLSGIAGVRIFGVVDEKFV